MIFPGLITTEKSFTLLLDLYQSPQRRLGGVIDSEENFVSAYKLCENLIGRVRSMSLFWLLNAEYVCWR
jgi:hypothetical protein